MNIEDLQRRAVAAPGWRWMAGMATVPNQEFGPGQVPKTWVIPVADGGLIDVGPHRARRGVLASALGQVEPGGGLGTRFPDLSDPAILGCLLALARERWGTTAHLVRFNTNVDDGEGGTKPACWWALAVGLASRPLARYRADGSCYYIAAPTEVEVLVRALEVAP